jgi:hypothetical protein
MGGGVVETVGVMLRVSVGVDVAARVSGRNTSIEIPMQ